MAEIGKHAGISRQGVYLNFADRADLMLALVRYVDEKRGLAKELKKITDAPTGLAALHEMVVIQARTNPDVWAIARALDAARRTDEEVEKSWQDRLDDRLRGCRQIVSRLAADGVLREGLKPGIAAEILWNLTSLHTWEDFVLQRGWTPSQYERHVYQMLLAFLTKQ